MANTGSEAITPTSTRIRLDHSEWAIASGASTTVGNTGAPPPPRAAPGSRT
jgi:hypothetical protein